MPQGQVWENNYHRSNRYSHVWVSEQEPEAVLAIWKREAIEKSIVPHGVGDRIMVGLEISL